MRSRPPKQGRYDREFIRIARTARAWVRDPAALLSAFALLGCRDALGIRPLELVEGGGGQAADTPAAPGCDGGAGAERDGCEGCTSGLDCAPGMACDTASRSCRPPQACDLCVTDLDCGSSFLCYAVIVRGKSGVCVRRGGSRASPSLTACEIENHCCTIEIGEAEPPYDDYRFSLCDPEVTCTLPAGDTSHSSDNCLGGGPPGPVDRECEDPLPPASASIADFCNPDALDVWGSAEGVWGLTQASSASVSLDTSGQLLRVRGTVSGSVEVRLHFGPCVDARAFQGVAFELGGRAGRSGVVRVSSFDASCRDGCLAPATEIAITETPSPFALRFGEFQGGSPAESIEPGSFVGVSWSFMAEAAPYELDVGIDDVRFW